MNTRVQFQNPCLNYHLPECSDEVDIMVTFQSGQNFCELSINYDWVERLQGKEKEECLVFCFTELCGDIFKPLPEASMVLLVSPRW